MALMEQPFPALERIHLESPFNRHLTVPSGFLGRCTGTLRHIHLRTISFPTMPQFLLSSHGLVSLLLGPDFLVGGKSLAPGALRVVLSATTRLEYLFFDCYHNVSRPVQEGAHFPSPDLIVLPSLAVFDFVGSVEYLEGLVSGIHAPLLVQLHVIFRGRHFLDISQLSQFIYRAASLRAPPRRTYIGLLINNFTIHHYFRDTPDLQGQEGPRLTFYFGQAARDMSEVVRVCQQLCPLVFGVRQLTINACRPPPRPEGKSPAAQWLELLAPFESVQELRVFGTKGPSAEIAHGLERSTSTSEMAKEVLPALGILRAGNCEIQAQRSIESFASACELSGRPLTRCAVNE